MITRLDIYNIIKNLDTNQRLLNLKNKIGYIWCYARLSLYFKLVATSSKSFPSKPYKKVSLLKAIIEVTKIFKIMKKKEDVVVVITRLKKNEKLEHFNDYIIGDFLTSLKNEKDLMLITQEKNQIFFENSLNIDYIYKIINFIGFFYVFNLKLIYNAFLLSKICYKETPLGFRTIFKTFLKGLAFSTVQKKFYHFMFKTIKPKKFFLTDFCSHLGSIAAAKSLGISSVDIQHGMFGPYDPTYSWPDLPKEEIPIPEKLIVWGDFWVQILSLKKTWAMDDIYISPPESLTHIKRTIQKTIPEKIIILFATQWVTRNHSLAFLTNLLELIKKSNIDVQIVIKLHRDDMSFKNLFVEIEQKFMNSCIVLDYSVDTYDLILKSSLVVSYASTILIESLILETPSISICCPTMEGGFSELFDFSKFSDTIYHIHNEYQLLDFIQNHLLNKNNQKKMLKKIQECTNFFFKDDGMDLNKRISKWKLL
jgi:hypothetical protein